MRRDGRRWTLWTTWIVGVFGAPGLLLAYLEPVTLPVAAICFAHAWFIPWLQARRGAESVVPIGSGRSATRLAGADRETDRVAIGLLGDLVGREELDLLADTGLAMQRGRLGVWLVGEQGAFLVRPGGRRVDCWCVRVAEQDGLPGADRVAHLLLALREDEAASRRSRTWGSRARRGGCGAGCPSARGRRSARRGRRRAPDSRAADHCR